MNMGWILALTAETGLQASEKVANYHVSNIHSLPVFRLPFLLIAKIWTSWMLYFLLLLLLLICDGNFYACACLKLGYLLCLCAHDCSTGGFVLHAVNQHFPLCCCFVPPSTVHVHTSPGIHREEHAARPLLRHPERGGAERHGHPLPQLWSPAWCPAAPQSLPVHVPAWEQQGTGPPEHSFAAGRHRKKKWIKSKQPNDNSTCILDTI